MYIHDEVDMASHLGRFIFAHIAVWPILLSNEALEMLRKPCLSTKYFLLSNVNLATKSASSRIESTNCVRTLKEKRCHKRRGSKRHHPHPNRHSHDTNTSTSRNPQHDLRLGQLPQAPRLHSP
ncbi:hypothetical protein K458DRAFT_31383 [Lentithecium fluviatile CBS 122367]|uniref:Uncharacterized protein n=1 Tax=Lentithecium fluviatile CBS 122367 TaxID=1168545 RepID=A0A6G1J2D6_9PLEO|nr:hypothetical protein K458DRAFT_31383 [Lentithecium fluviatile CBS 122367]